ncbi:P-loop containing nucleoside triphosphate hydrolase protein [Hygrophoropsis aurantiaca]|uniref:P-loop containing nucleoside triphosphate hydrolase protein n=1 Tax=Hygrophoropsis aurantiaca TaxID=72124 RepID=A0ACB8A6N2_9AGAM|nr:P-loop containing nucleoside triphosphate hydrolase protein [Hygrophoropsis aurantiaca]
MPTMKNKWKKTELKQGDTIMTNPRSDDIIIPIMGPTGVGKSTFINTAAGKDVTKVGHNLESCTAAIVHAIVPHPNYPSRRVVFVDTPGFDDTYEDDTEILRRIAVWLAHSYSDNVKLSGIIYLHEITQARMVGTSRKNFEMFEKLCGIESAQNVILATTKWGNIKSDAGERRASQLETFWKDMLSAGSQMERFNGSQKSAWDIVKTITDKKLLEALQIQNELVNLGKLLPQTEAGNALRTSLKNLVAEHKKTIMELRSEKGDGQQVDDRLKETESQIKSLLGQIQELKIPLSKRILAWFGLG